MSVQALLWGSFMRVRIDVSMSKAIKQKCVRSLGKFTEAEHLR